MQIASGTCDLECILRDLESLGSEQNRAGMARFGIKVERAYGVSVVHLRRIAKRCGRDHQLAEQLWSSGRHEARILASMVDDPAKVTEDQMEQWIAEFDSWDLCDQVYLNLFGYTKFAWKKPAPWSKRTAEFEKRAAFALIAGLAVHDKTTPDARFVRLLPLIEKQSGDDRNLVRKAVNWALRQIGKRNAHLREEALACADRILEANTRAGRWIARDAIRELRSL